MKNFGQFLLLGAFALTTHFNALASQENVGLNGGNISLEKMQQEVNNIINKQFGKNYLTERASVDIKIIKSSSEDDGNVADFKMVNNDSHFKRENQQCKVSLDYSENGDIPFLGETENIKDLFAENTEEEKRYLREFVALHEHFHCEFSGIKEPIKLSGASKELNERMNYHSKGIVSLINSNIKDKYASYIDTLNENFADISAAMALIKEYGSNNKELMKTLNRLSAERHDNYLNTKIDNHFTNFGLDQLLKPENIKRVQNIKTSEEFKNIALEFANIGAEKVLIEKKGFAESAFSYKAFRDSFEYEVRQEISQQLGDLKIKGKPIMEKMETNWKPNNHKNISTDLALEVTEEINFKNFREKIQNNEISSEIFTIGSTTIQNVGEENIKRVYSDYKTTVDEFLQTVDKKHLGLAEEPTSVVLEKSAVTKQIKDLRYKYLGNKIESRQKITIK